MSSSRSTPSVLLRTGVQMPLLGLGTYKLLAPEEVYRSVDAALAAGYRAFDSAAMYENEAQLGRALKELLPKHGLTREDVFITRWCIEPHISNRRVCHVSKYVTFEVLYKESFVPAVLWTCMSSWKQRENKHIDGTLVLWCETNYPLFNLPQIFSLFCLCSKLESKDQGERAMEGALRSLSQLDLGYIDLYLIHWPGTQGLEASDQRNPGKERSLS